MKLQPADIPILLGAIEDSLDPFSLEMVLASRLKGFRLVTVAAPTLPFPNQALAVVRHFQGRNEIELLVAALRDALPRVIEFVALADRLGFTNLPTSDALEVLVRKDGQPYADVDEFRTTLAMRENAVCRVETAYGYGTGVLVGANLVLTNRHVVATSIDETGTLSGSVLCRFDYKQTKDQNVSEGMTVEVDAVPASSPHAAADLQSQGDNQDAEKLDYAILRLARKFGDLPLVQGGEKRGFVSVGQSPRVLDVAEGLLVLQHPKAKPMKVDIGAVTWRGATRLRHSVNTEGGSSGAPVFDSSLNLAALHHAGYDWPRADYPHNQAIPLGLIAADAARLGVTL